MDCNNIQRINNIEIDSKYLLIIYIFILVFISHKLPYCLLRFVCTLNRLCLSKKSILSPMMTSCFKLNDSDMVEYRI